MNFENANMKTHEFFTRFIHCEKRFVLERNPRFPHFAQVGQYSGFYWFTQIGCIFLNPIC